MTARGKGGVRDERRGVSTAKQTSGAGWVLVALALGAVACTQPRPVESVVLAATLPLTGPDAPLGRAMARGYQRAVDEVNDAGGLLLSGSARRVAVRLDLRDDGAEVARAEALARDALEGGAHALLSTATGVRAVAQVVVAERLERPHFVNPVEAAGVSVAHARWTFLVDVEGATPEARAHETARAALTAIERAGTPDPMMVRASLERP